MLRFYQLQPSGPGNFLPFTCVHLLNHIRKTWSVHLSCSPEARVHLCKRPRCDLGSENERDRITLATLPHGVPKCEQANLLATCDAVLITSAPAPAASSPALEHARKSPSTGYLAVVADGFRVISMSRSPSIIASVSFFAKAVLMIGEEDSDSIVTPTEALTQRSNMQASGACVRSRRRN